jgi:hypothetical protein
MENDRASVHMMEEGFLADAQDPLLPSIPPAIVKTCMSRKVVVPKEIDGKLWFSSNDIVRMKIIHAMVLQSRIQTALKVSYQKAGVDFKQDFKRLQQSPNIREFMECAKELIDSKSS